MIPAMPAPLRKVIPSGRPQGCAPTRLRISILALVLTVMLTLFLYPVHIARASGGSYIRWDATMIYPGQNQNHPWGPVGERATVHGLDLGRGNQQFSLVLVQGDTANNGLSLCQQAGTNLGTVMTDSSGNFDFSFNWPAAAGQMNAVYSVCGLHEPGGTPGLWMFDGPFTVLASSPPIISLSTSSVAAGDIVTVTGQNWVPVQAITIIIAACADCGAGNTIVANVSVNSSGINSGNFSIAIPIPASAKPGNYVVNALSQNGLLDANTTTTNGAKHLTITAPAVTPTPTSTTVPTATAAPTTVATTTAVPTAVPPVVPTNADTGSSSNTNSNLGFIIGLVIAIVLILGAIIGVIALMVVRRSSRRLYTPPGVPGQFMQQAPGSSSSYNPTVLGQQVPLAGRPTPPFASPGQFGQTTPNTFPTNSPGSMGRNTPPFAPPDQFGQTAPTAFPANSSGTYGRSTPSLFCTNCGGPLQPDETFCGQCGTLAQVTRPEGDSPTWVR